MSDVGDFIGDTVGGITGAKQAGESAERAAQAQSAAAQAGIAEQRRQFDKLIELMQPYVSVGEEAMQAQRALLGLGGGPIYEEVQMTPEEIFQKQLEASGYTQADLERAQGSVLGNSAMMDKIRSIDVGTTKNVMVGSKSPEEAQAEAIGALQASPQYQSMVQSGEEAIMQGASATGGLRGGNIQGALAQYRPQVLSNLINQQYAKLGGLSSLGQASAAGQASSGMQSASDIANLLGQSGAAQAGGIMARGGITRGTFGDLLSVAGAGAAASEAGLF